ncbi:hypothetical protein [Sulfurospirillum cavolei]|uniref:hypothetical protein n=1 Tax=Sulfurospirillum cavolei TaxID=366522 RepID=UPI0007649235|nr:hypothetical protein [Sulfurospirillum cavolei]
MFENTKAILHSIVEGKPPRKGTKTYAKIDDALFEVFTAKQKLQAAEKEIAELKERAACGQKFKAEANDESKL